MYPRPLCSLHTNRIIHVALLMVCAALAAPAWGQVINEDRKLLPLDGQLGDQFGQSIAIHNGVVAIGANTDDDNGLNSGSAYVMHLILDLAPVKLLPNDGSAGDLFGWSIAIGTGDLGAGSIDVVAVGAPNDSVSAANSGSAYLFRTSGTQLAKLVPNDGALGDNFGVSVAIDNNIVVVGTPEDDDNGTDSGSAYLFNVSTGLQIAKLLPDDGGPNDGFGHAVSISQGIVAVSALRHQNNGIESGSVYLFDAAKGVQLAELSSNEGVLFEQFGYSVAIDEGVVAVGALATGLAYVYDASTFALLTTLTPSTPGNAFGWSIDLDGSKVTVGALLDPINGSGSGSAYLFNAFSGSELGKLLPSDGALQEQFGSSIGIDNDLIVVGARNDDDNGQGSGSAYSFDIGCPPDLNGDGILDFFDVVAFLAAFSAQSPIADWNQDGVFNFFDVAAYLAAFSAGCL
jgi:FG-GAP repeat